jgi:SAM-dependent methyltransferase
MTNDRNRLRTTFDEAASLYDEVRPGYPDDLFGDVVSLSGIRAGGRILEIGCGTGQATLPFARRGYRILCIELGKNMAALARRNLEGYEQAEVRTEAFEESSLQEGAFDLAISATAFHWLDPAIAYPKAAEALREGGSLALFWNVHVHSDASEGFFEAAQRIYEREAPEIVGPEDYKGLPRPHEVADWTEEIQNTNLFGSVTTRHYRWDVSYDSCGYLRVLSTYSGHKSLNDDTRRRLFRGLADLIDNSFDGRIVKGYLTTLYVAHRR